MTGPLLKLLPPQSVGPKSGAEREAAYRERHPERAKESQERYKRGPSREKYLQASRERSRRRREDHYNETLWFSARQRARRDGVAFEIAIEDIIVPPCCPVLGIALQRSVGCIADNSPSLDRIDPKRGYVLGNIAVISVRANRIKNDASPEELERVLAWMRAALSGDADA
jgi:hypothetical protein